ncbi:MAG: hypothetical protein QNJ20_04650 [Paracoccaceae bacterium]|nr:hypothetical protein [Paracoccaceae bacterium]
MSDERQSPPVDLGIYGRQDTPPGMDPIDRLALVASSAWFLAALVFLFVSGVGDGNSLGPLRFLVVILALFLPVALIWIAAIALKSARIIRDESERLQASMDAMRQLYVSQAQIAATTMGPNVERKIDEIVKAQRRAEETLTNFAVHAPPNIPDPQTPPSTEVPRANDGQIALELASSMPDTRIAKQDFISALNFPETAEDKAGFEALRRALADRRASVLVRASQDILTLLSQDGIYMDDLTPERARPEVWRKFAGGERGPAVAGIGGIRDRSSLALSAARMRQDTIFRDAAHHFLRTFDKTFSQMIDELSDQDIVAIAETRTARAFMLLGRVTGIFT